MGSSSLAGAKLEIIMDHSTCENLLAWVNGSGSGVLSFCLLYTSELVIGDEREEGNLLGLLQTALSSLDTGELSIGARRSRGFGRMAAQSWRAYRYSLSCARSWCTCLLYTSFPFSHAYTIAEKLCRSAKDGRREKDDQGSWLDWHVGLVKPEDAIVATRKRDYVVNNSSSSIEMCIRDSYLPGKQSRHSQRELCFN